MTFKQLERIRQALCELEEIRKSPNAKRIYHLDENLSNFLGKEYPSPSLLVGVDIMYENDSSAEDMFSDIDRIKSTLEGMIAQHSNYSLANEIIDLIDEGKAIGEDYSSRQQFIAKAYFSYGDCIKFDSSLIAIAKDSIVRKSTMDFDFGETETSVDDVVIQSVIAKLQQYAKSILQKRETAPSPKKGNPTVVVNNIATATNSVNIDISVEIENAIKQVEDACLPDAQEKEVLAKIQELKDIMESKESKGKRWAKIKDFFKWVAEQGIQVASIIVPLLASTIK